MIGRGAIRNPWLFRQIRQHQRGETLYAPAGHEVLAMSAPFTRRFAPPTCGNLPQVQKMKKYMNYLGVGVDPTESSCTRSAASRPKPIF